MRNNQGAICGGIISETMNRRNIKKHGIWFDTMAYLLPDKQYKKYVDFKMQGKRKEATRIFDKFAIGQI